MPRNAPNQGATSSNGAPKGRATAASVGVKDGMPHKHMNNKNHENQSYKKFYREVFQVMAWPLPCFIYLLDMP
jgi:hypothetical protein